MIRFSQFTQAEVEGSAEISRDNSVFVINSYTDNKLGGSGPIARVAEISVVSLIAIYGTIVVMTILYLDDALEFLHI